MVNPMTASPIQEIPCGHISLNGRTYDLLLVNKQPCIEVSGKRYHNQDELLKGDPTLQKTAQEAHELEKLARLVMFSRFGEKYKVGNVEEFKDLLRKKNLDDPFAFGEGGAGYADLEQREIECMCAPKVENSIFVFFCIDDYLEQPYKITLPFPVREGHKPSFEPLPIAGD